MKFDVFKHQNQFVSTTDKYPALVAGYGSGKTYAFCLKALAELGRNPGKTILLAEPVYPMIRDVLQPTMEEVLHNVGFSYTYRASEYKYKIHWNGGWGNIIMRSAENWRRWAGLNLAGFGIDEAALLKDDSAWKMGISRLRDGNHLTGWTATTPEGFNWVYDWWKDEPKSGYKLIQGKTTDNRFLPKEFVNSLYENYDERLIKAYINGEFVNLQYGQAYYMFDRRKHVKKCNYNENKLVQIAVDFNISPMCATIFQTYNDKPYIRVIDEIKLRHSTEGDLMTELLAKEVKRRYPKSEYNKEDVLKKDRIQPYIAFPDPSGKQRRTSSPITDHQILMREGFKLKVKPQAPRVTDRMNAVNNAFDFMIIDPKCKGLIKDFEQVILKEGTRDLDKSNPDLTHFSDGLGYAIDILYPVKRPKPQSYMA